MKTIPLGPFIGINNRLPDFSLRTKGGDFVRQAINLDLLGNGTFKTRDTASLLQSVTAPHSLHGSMLVRASALYAVTLPSYSETLLKVLSNNGRMSYVDFNGDTYFSNGVDSGRVSGGTVFPMGLPSPVAPAVSSIAGALPAGSYQVAVSYKNATTGEEGGVSPSVSHALTNGGALRVSLPAATLGATHINVFVSTLNGSIPLLQTTVTVGTASVDVTSIAIGREAVERYEAPLPPGRLFMFNGCLCSYRDNCVYEGLPFRPGYYLPSEGRIPFPAKVTNCVPAQNGIYIVADKTYWIPGSRITTADGVIQDVLPYGGVLGTEFEAPHKSIYGWFGEKGIVLATAQGEVEAVMTENVDVSALPEEGFSTVFEGGGYRRVVSCGYCMNLDNLGVTTYSEWDYTSISDGYATRADGVYVFDSANSVTWLLDIGRQNFGSENLKHLPAAYIGCASSEAVTMTVTTPSGESYSYDAKSFSDGVEIHRIDPGKGLRANWYGLAFGSESGSLLYSLASISFAPTTSTRRIYHG